jgi:hypothetical protein
MRLISALLILVASASAQGLLVRGSGGGAPGPSFPTPTHTYLLDEGSGSTVNDSETAGNDGTFPGSSADPTWAGGGLTFASGDYVPLGSLFSLAIETAANTVCTTYSLPDTGANRSAIGEYDGDGWWLGGTVNSSHKAEFFARTSGTGNGLRVQFGGSPATSTWYHVCVALPANPTCATAGVFVNGADASSGQNCPQDNLSSDPAYSGNQARFGTQSTVGTANGQVVGVTRIWKGTQLNSTQIAAVCNADKTVMAGRSITLQCP